MMTAAPIRSGVVLVLSLCCACSGDSGVGPHDAGGAETSSDGPNVPKGSGGVSAKTDASGADGENGAGGAAPVDAEAGGTGAQGADSGLAGTSATGGKGGRSPPDASDTDSGIGRTPDASLADAATERNYSTDRSLFFGQSRCEAAHLAFCDDFESGSLAGYVLTGTPTIDGVRAARGAKALHVVSPTSVKTVIETSAIFPAPKNSYYGRLFVYFVAIPTPVGASQYAHWTIVAATGDNVSGEIRVGAQMFGSYTFFGVGTDNQVDPTGTGDWTNSDQDPGGQPESIPLHQWLCIEWLHDGETNETRFYWDGIEHPSLYTSSTVHGKSDGFDNPYILPQFRHVWFGLHEYQKIEKPDGGLQEYELFIDEVALDSKRIGCVL